ncbi:hypothetical protein [Parendozoicomonas haliclonae]|uniref:hypothetical protein n=1 Tax=Parendozoicomonas haliclonae TaxID=1960125 RepID=UPI0013FDFF9D|nr:hypothetical protein [Parendozoicomonas haliclonae]
MGEARGFPGILSLPQPYKAAPQLPSLFQNNQCSSILEQHRIMHTLYQGLWQHTFRTL